VRAAVVVLAASILAATAGATSQTTRVQVFRPFANGKLAAGLSVAKSFNGSCWEGSLADPRKDAWRCFIGNSINDPCFSDSHVRTWVACPADGTPFGTTVLRLNLTKPLPRSLANRGSPGEGDPWAIRLPGGKVCTFLTGATFAFHGKRVNYGCTKTLFLAGSPDRSKPTWTITSGTGPKAPPRAELVLVAAW
jgi:hypothetical protein